MLFNGQSLNKAFVVGFKIGMVDSQWKAKIHVMLSTKNEHGSAAYVGDWYFATVEEAKTALIALDAELNK